MKKPVYYATMTVLVELEIRADSQEHATAMLRHKMQTLAATNPDLAVHELVSKWPIPNQGIDLRPFDLVPLP